MVYNLPTLGWALFAGARCRGRLAGGNDCPGGKAVDIGYNASTIGLDDPTLDALGNAANATRIISAGLSGTFGQATATRGPRESRLKLIF